MKVRRLREVDPRIGGLGGVRRGRVEPRTESEVGGVPEGTGVCFVGDGVRDEDGSLRRGVTDK